MLLTRGDLQPGAAPGPLKKNFREKKASGEGEEKAPSSPL